MGINDILLVCAALFPAIVLCIFIYTKDRVEKEPVGLLLLLLALGVAICFPASLIESALDSIINSVFSLFGTMEGDTLVLDSATYTMYHIISNFIGIALVEEGLKWLVMFLVTRNNKNFNSLFDGVVYAVFVSLGFAAFENVLYVLEYGWLNALMRAIMSVPGHMFFAVIMGCNYSMWHMYSLAKKEEIRLKRNGLIDKFAFEFSPGKHLVFSLLIPIFIHGLYDYYCTVGGLAATLSLYALLIFLYIFCFIRIGKLSKDDLPDHTYSQVLIFQKYPHILASIQKQAEERSRMMMYEEIKNANADKSASQNNDFINI